QVGEVMAVCERWEVPATPIGSVTAEPHVRVLRAGTLVADLPVEVLVDDCPLYDLQPIQPAIDVYSPPDAVLSADAEPAEVLQALLAAPNLASRRAVVEPHDPGVPSPTGRPPRGFCCGPRPPRWGLRSPAPAPGWRPIPAAARRRRSTNAPRTSRASA